MGAGFGFFLRDMRLQGLGAMFGVNLCPVSCGAAVRYEGLGEAAHSGGYFVRSKINRALMQAVGNAPAEFKFHAFGHAGIVLLRAGPPSLAGIDPLFTRPPCRCL